MQGRTISEAEFYAVKERLNQRKKKRYVNRFDLSLNGICEQFNLSLTVVSRINRSENYTDYTNKHREYSNKYSNK